ncbi:MAG TPA: VanW family protein [Polyangiaceae bacterium]|jgi:vancomycin resistance protein YoaR
MSILPRLSILAVLAAGGGSWGLHARSLYFPAGEALPGLRVDGETVSGTLRAAVAARANALIARRVRVTSSRGDDLGEHTLGELGVTVDVDAAVARAARIGHEGDFLARADAAERARRGEIDVPLEPALDTAPWVQTIAKYKESLDVRPASARLDLDDHKVLPEKPGRYLDAFGAIDALQRAARDPKVAEIVVPFAEVAPRVSSDFVGKLDVHAVLGSYETYFSRSGEQKRRGTNIDVAASKLDGVVLMPGEIVSFNAVVGDRSVENGFEKSWQIYKGEMVEGVGGGTCQVASTLHAAAFFAGLEIVERLPHSRPSGYIPMGLDATVVYPIVDLKLRNPNSFPVVIHAKTSGPKLTIELLGAARTAKVTFARELLETKPYPRKVDEDARVAADKIVVKQHGIQGFKIKRTRTIALADGTRKVETNVDFYPPTTEIYDVPPGFDESTLPPLPGDADATATASATPPPAPVNVVFIDAPGAHAPTDAQKAPEKKLTFTR